MGLVISIYNILMLTGLDGTHKDTHIFIKIKIIMKNQLRWVKQTFYR